MLARLHKEYSAAQVRILALNVVPQFPTPEFLRYMKSLGGGDHLYAVDTDLRIASAYEVRSLGETVFVDRRGSLAGRIPPLSASYDEFKQALQRLLA